MRRLGSGAAWPILVVAGLQFGVGASIFLRSAKDATRVQMQFSEPSRPKIKSEELPRMEKVMTQFVALRWVEIALFVVGLGLFFGKRGGENDWLMGLGAGLAVQVFLMLVADFFAEKRGHE